MNDILKLILILLTGSATGIFFFGGLWYTTKKGAVSKMPAMWFIASFITRMAVTLLTFYYVTGGNWKNLLVCLAGFTIARFAVIYLTKPEKENSGIVFKEETR